MKWIFLAVGIILLLSYTKKSIASTLTDAAGNPLPPDITPENSTLSNLGGLDPGYSNPCACKTGGSSSVRTSQNAPGFSSSGGIGTGSPANPLTINPIGQVVSSATGLPANIFTGGF